MRILPSAREPWSAFTHLLGLLGAIVGLVFLVLEAGADGVRLTGALIFGISLIALFAASTAYHYFDLGGDANGKLRRLDHAAIYLLIAGTYVPSLIHLLEGTWRITMLTVIGVLAVAGVLFKMVWFNTSSKGGALLYVAMGWVIVVAAHEIWPVISPRQATFLIGGGLIYTLGAVVYATRWPDPWPQRFGHHEVWHLFVLGGAAAHYFFVLDLVGGPYPAFTPV
jgi:hemolysin III